MDSIFWSFFGTDKIKVVVRKHINSKELIDFAKRKKINVSELIDKLEDKFLIDALSKIYFSDDEVIERIKKEVITRVKSADKYNTLEINEKNVKIGLLSVYTDGADAVAEYFIYLK